jgi:glycosidase
MPTSIWSPEVLAALERVPTPFPSPADWRDHWIYSILVDRFNHPLTPPHAPWDQAQREFQGGSFAGVRAQLPYLQELGVGALLLSPVLKNCQHDATTYHGYGPQNFLEIEPRFASDQGARRDPRRAGRELRDLVDDAHARGMYVILDVVLNHAGNVFVYAEGGPCAAWRETPYPIHWRDEHGRPRPDWLEIRDNGHADAAVQPLELCQPRCFVRRGQAHKVGDFYSYRKLATDSQTVRETLLQIHKYLIAAYDVDGFRIDALDLLDEEFAFLFPDEIRSYALSIGKANFLLFGEITAADQEIARYLGRSCPTRPDLVGVDAMLDYPLFFVLPQIVKGFAPPLELARLFERRRELHRSIVGSRAEPGALFVTFLDNHDQHRRFYHRAPGSPGKLYDQVTLGFGCLFALPGLPSLYYGSEQGLAGTRERYGDAGLRPLYEWVRESLWGKPNAFDRRHPFYCAIQRLGAVRRARPALRYGRTYFQPVSGDGVVFDHGAATPGIVAFSRLVSDDEVVCVANAGTRRGWSGEVIVDDARNPVGATFEVLFSNQAEPAMPGPVSQKAGRAVVIREADDVVTDGPARTIAVELRPMEIQILGRRRGT